MHKFASASLWVAGVAPSLATSAQILDNWTNGNGELVWKNGTHEMCFRNSGWRPATGSAGCEGAMPPRNPVPEFDAETRFYMLKRDMVWKIGNTGVELVVPAGFVTDLASIPKAFWSFGLSPAAQYTRAAIIHDYLYWTHICEKPQADNLLLVAMKESEVGKFDEVVVYSGVAVFGEGSWDKNKKERAKGLIRIAPKDERFFLPNEKWEDRRKYFLAQGYKDPVFQKNQPFCRFGDSQVVPIIPGRPTVKELLTEEILDVIAAGKEQRPKE